MKDRMPVMKRQPKLRENPESADSCPPRGTETGDASPYASGLDSTSRPGKTSRRTPTAASGETAALGLKKAFPRLLIALVVISVIIFGVRYLSKDDGDDQGARSLAAVQGPVDAPFKNRISQEKKMPLKILFVCYGNTCRSPMAMGIARKLLGGQVLAESAGIAPAYSGAAEEAILVMKSMYGTDISDHEPRSVADVDVAAFDFIIALDLSIFTHLRETGRIPEERLFGWDIEDPIGLGYSAYKRTAGKIEKRLSQFLENQGVVI